MASTWCQDFNCCLLCLLSKTLRWGLRLCHLLFVFTYKKSLGRKYTVSAQRTDFLRYSMGNTLLKGKIPAIIPRSAQILPHLVVHIFLLLLFVVFAVYESVPVAGIIQSHEILSTHCIWQPRQIYKKNLLQKADWNPSYSNRSSSQYPILCFRRNFLQLHAYLPSCGPISTITNACNDRHTISHGLRQGDWPPASEIYTQASRSVM